MELVYNFAQLLLEGTLEPTRALAVALFYLGIPSSVRGDEFVAEMQKLPPELVSATAKLLRLVPPDLLQYVLPQVHREDWLPPGVTQEMLASAATCMNTLVSTVRYMLPARTVREEQDPSESASLRPELGVFAQLPDALLVIAGAFVMMNITPEEMLPGMLQAPIDQVLALAEVFQWIPRSLIQDCLPSTVKGSKGLDPALTPGELTALTETLRISEAKLQTIIAIIANFPRIQDEDE